MGKAKPKNSVLTAHIGANAMRGKRTLTMTASWSFTIDRLTAKEIYGEWCERTALNEDVSESYQGSAYSRYTYDRTQSKYFRLVLLCLQKCAFLMDCKVRDVTMSVQEMEVREGE